MKWKLRQRFLEIWAWCIMPCKLCHYSFSTLKQLPVNQQFFHQIIFPTDSSRISVLCRVSYRCVFRLLHFLEDVRWCLPLFPLLHSLRVMAYSAWTAVGKESMTASSSSRKCLTDVWNLTRGIISPGECISLDQTAQMRPNNFHGCTSPDSWHTQNVSYVTLSDSENYHQRGKSQSGWLKIWRSHQLWWTGWPSVRISDAKMFTLDYKWGTSFEKF